MLLLLRRPPAPPMTVHGTFAFTVTAAGRRWEVAGSVETTVREVGG